jgi:hypothetical protein
MTETHPFLVLVATQRSGTNALRSMIAKCTGVTDLKEALSGNCEDGLHHEMVRSIRERGDFGFSAAELTNVFDGYLAKAGTTHRNSKLLLIDCKYNAFGPFTPFGWSPIREPFFLRYCLRKRMRIVHLTRDPLATYISALRVRRTKEWHRRQDTEQRLERVEHAIEINLATLAGELRRRRAETAFFRQCLGGYPQTIEASYESLFGPKASREAMDRLGDFIGIRLEDTKPDYVKIIHDWRDLIANHREVTQFMDEFRDESNTPSGS